MRRRVARGSRPPTLQQRTLAHAGPPSLAVPTMRASRTVPGLEIALSINSQVMPDSGTLARPCVPWNRPKILGSARNFSDRVQAS